MSLLSPFSELKEVRGTVLCDHAGNLTESSGDAQDTVPAANIADLVRRLNECGQLLGLGAMKKVLLKGEKSTCLAASRNGAILAVFLDPKKSITEIEKRIESTAWDTIQKNSESSASETTMKTPNSSASQDAIAGRGEGEKPERPFSVTNQAAPSRRPQRRGIATVPLLEAVVRSENAPPCWKKRTPGSAPRWYVVSSLRPRVSAT